MTLSERLPPPAAPAPVDQGRSQPDAGQARAAGILEVCIDDAAGLAAATAGGADRVELCAALALGGLTPSPGLMALAAESRLPAHVMIRPRAGDFIVSAADLDLMRRDMDAVRNTGLAGVVFGCSLPSGELDVKAVSILVAHAGETGLDMTLHRAFDLAPDLDTALEAAIGLGFTRILSSGGAANAFAGRERLAELSEKARGRITIMPGVGVNAGNVSEIISHTGATEIHASCSRPIALAKRERAMGFGGDGDLKATSVEAVAELARLIHAA